MNATLWIDQWDHFSMEHLEEWAEQKEQECALNDLERDTEVVYRAHIIRMQEDKVLTNSKEAEGPRMLPYYSETPTYIPQFDIAKVGVLPKMSPVIDQENALLNVAPGSPVIRAAPPGLGRGQGG